MREKVTCQRFFGEGPLSILFEVKEPATIDDEQAPTVILDDNGGKAQLLLGLSIDLDRARALHRDTIREGGRTETNAWLSRTGWSTYLAGHSPIYLLTLTRRPNPSEEPELFAVCERLRRIVRIAVFTTRYRVNHFTRRLLNRD